MQRDGEVKKIKKSHLLKKERESTREGIMDAGAIITTSINVKHCS